MTNVNELNKYKVQAYVVLVKAGKYILGEEYREHDYQMLVPQEYIIAVSDYIIEPIKQ